MLTSGSLQNINQHQSGSSRLFLRVKNFPLVAREMRCEVVPSARTAVAGSVRQLVMAEQAPAIGLMFGFKLERNRTRAFPSSRQGYTIPSLHQINRFLSNRQNRFGTGHGCERFMGRGGVL
jgi:hypothetical protein